MAKPFDPTKPVQLRDGSPARIIGTINADKQWAKWVVVFIRKSDGDEGITFMRCDGHGRTFPHKELPDDLVNVPERRSEWQRIYKKRHEAAQRYSQEFLRDLRSEGIILGFNEYIFEDDELIDVKFHKELPKE